ncbi:hypothetical protein [Burkholderia sp. LMG 32019]|uniref:hypothetical protein n=1 Tax=Burkholderia sp. LMG 32019 TaxID=3158173 RepID=UPI003C2CE870
MKRRAFGVVAALCCMPALAAGVLKLSRTELTLEPGKPPGELYVENVGDTPLYLSVEQTLLTNPGQTPEHLVPVSAVSRPGLLVLPNRLTVAPGQKYRIGLRTFDTPPGTPADTQVWRVTFRPKERIVVDTVQGDGAHAPLFVSVGYGVLIYQLKHARAE